MSNSFRDLFEYDPVKRCSKSGNFSIKSNFYKILTSQFGLKPHCKTYKKQH